MWLTFDVGRDGWFVNSCKGKGNLSLCGSVVCVGTLGQSRRHIEAARRVKDVAAAGWLHWLTRMPAQAEIIRIQPVAAAAIMFFRDTDVT